MQLKVIYTVFENGHGGPAASSTHVARSPKAVSAGVVVEASRQYATIPLKACLMVLCFARPDLIPDTDTDHSVSVLDHRDSETTGTRVLEGLGMLAWVLAETGDGSTRVNGKVRNTASGDASASDDTLEVVLELKPRKPLPRDCFLSALEPTKAPVAPPAAPASIAESTSKQLVTLPDGSSIDGGAALALLQALVTASGTASQTASTTSSSASSIEVQDQAKQLVSSLAGGNMALLPGIDLFNPVQAKAVQQAAQNSNVILPPSLSSGSQSASTQETGKQQSQRPKAKPRASHSKSSSTSIFMPIAPKLPQKQSTSSEKAQGSAARAVPAHPTSYDLPVLEFSSVQSSSRGAHSRPLKFWPDGCLQCGKTQSTGWRVRKKRKAPLDPALGSGDHLVDNDDELKKLCEECAQHLPSERQKRKRARELAASRADGQRSDGPAVAQTSPLRRSPRRHPGAHDLGRVNGGLSAAPLTSPTGLGSRLAASNSKRRKFTSALSAAALREEGRSASAGLTPESEVLPPIPAFKPNGNNDSKNAGNGADTCQAKEVFGSASGQKANTGEISHEDESFSFFLNASPGTIMRSFNMGSPQKGGNQTPGAGDFPRFVSGCSPRRPLLAGSQGVSAVFSPLGSSLPTPFRALLNGAGKEERRERATSEQPPASHSKLMDQLGISKAKEELPENDADKNNVNQFLQFVSSDDNLLGSNSNLQINLLPPTADRRQGNAAGLATNQVLSDSIMDDFSSFLLNSSNNLFSPTPFNSKANDATGKPALAPLQFSLGNGNFPSSTSAGGASNNLPILSSEMDFDLSNLPPSSPPPLPGSSHAASASLANVQDFWSNFNSSIPGSGGYLGLGHNGNMDDGQSPISITTSVTQGGTPQDMPISHETGSTEPGSLLNAGNANDKIAMSDYNQSFATDSPLSVDIGGVQDPLFDYFPQYMSGAEQGPPSGPAHHRQSSVSSVSSAFLDRLRASASGTSTKLKSSSSMSMTWSDSTSSSCSITSLPVTDLTARSRQLQQQKLAEQAKKAEALDVISPGVQSPTDTLFSVEA